MTVSKVQSATREDADWGFVENDRIMGVVGTAVERTIRQFRTAPGCPTPGDLKQDVLLWLAVRPQVQECDPGLLYVAVERQARKICRKLADEHSVLEGLPDEWQV